MAVLRACAATISPVRCDGTGRAKGTLFGKMLRGWYADPSDVHHDEHVASIWRVGFPALPGRAPCAKCVAPVGRKFLRNGFRRRLHIGRKSAPHT